MATSPSIWCSRSTPRRTRRRRTDPLAGSRRGCADGIDNAAEDSLSHWAIDLGTTNTALSRWDDGEERARIVELPAICRDPTANDPLHAPRLLPSATHMLAGTDLWTQLGRLPLVSSYRFWGQQALIGRPALERNRTRIHPCFVAAWKPYLGAQSLRPIARIGRRHFSARDVVRTYLRELLAEVYRVHGERIRSLVVTAPVDAYESYRAEVRTLLRGLGVHKVRFVDEPVAAAAGYGLASASHRLVLVVDFGGGTLDLALVRLDARDLAKGQCTVLAKAGRPIGGNAVDDWLLESFCQRLDYQLPKRGSDDDTFWYRLMLSEARWVKEQLFFRDSETFYLNPPEEMRAFQAQVRGEDPQIEVSRAEFLNLLKTRGLYDTLDACTQEVLARAESQGIRPDAIDDVLMVGGSTLLPGVFQHFEGRFGRDRVRAWHPFEAVAQGACALDARGFQPVDYIVHDYALSLYDAKTGEPHHEVIIPRGTRFPTDDVWRRKLVPTCALGEPERVFELVVCEIGTSHGGAQAFGWDRGGKLHQLSDGEALVVPLNEANPALGQLSPPHLPGDRTPRLDVAFGINADRWLCATVIDLKRGRHLMTRRPVVRLL